MSAPPSPPPTYSGPPESSEHEPLLESEDLEALTRHGIQQQPEGREGDTWAKYAAIISVLVLLFTTWVTILRNDPKTLGWFALHPTLQTLALSFFTYGILTLQLTFRPQTKIAGLGRHQIAMLVLGFPTILFGGSFMFYNKISHGAPHFTSWHGRFGLIALVWITLQILIGASSVWFGGAIFGGGAKAKAVYKYHRLSGYILFSWLLLTAHLGGAWSTWMVDHISYATSVLAYTAAPVVLLISVYSRIRMSKMNFL